jgi:hypothetical protein
MLIVYRTNAGFEGQIQSVDKTLISPEMDAYLEQHPDANVAYLDIDEYSIGRAAVKDFALNRDLYTVDVALKKLLRAGVAVSWAP